MKKDIRKKLYDALELPSELLKDVSRVTILGSEDIWVENYRGILEYNEDFIRLNNNICVYGNMLHVEEINDVNILITGNIKTVEFE